jgi:lipid-binding SYLF domain-containing protein
MNSRFANTAAALAATVVLAFTAVSPVAAQGTAALDGNARQAYGKLVASVPAARELGRQAVAVLVFPKITKAGLVVGGQYGEGVLLRGGKPARSLQHHRSIVRAAGRCAAVWLRDVLHEREGAERADRDRWLRGRGRASVVVVDEGMAKASTSITTKDDIYAFIFSQKGLMAGIGLQGNKITKLAK